MADEWSDHIKQWLIDGEQCVAGALAGEDFVVYAGCSKGDIADWNMVYAEDFEADITNEDGSNSKITINEAAVMTEAFESGKAPNGVFIGGVKYRMIRKFTDEENGDSNITRIFVAKPKGGAHIIKNEKGYVIIAIFDEDEPYIQSPSGSLTAALAYAAELNASG